MTSMFRKKQAACDLNKARLAYYVQFQKGKEMGSDEAVQAEPVPWSENDTHRVSFSDAASMVVLRYSPKPSV